MLGDFVDKVLDDTLESEEEVHLISERLREFWREQHVNMANLNIDSEQGFKNHNDLPLARIKRIMKSDEDVRMISAEAPVLFAKACELFILELTLRASVYSTQSKRKTLQREDIIAAIHKTETLDFLVDSVGRTEPAPSFHPADTL